MDASLAEALASVYQAVQGVCRVLEDIRPAGGFVAARSPAIVVDLEGVKRRMEEAAPYEGVSLSAEELDALMAWLNTEAGREWRLALRRSRR